MRAKNRAALVAALSLTLTLPIALTRGADAQARSTDRLGVAAARPAPVSPDRSTAAGSTSSLPSDWRTSRDRLWTVRGDATGLHLLAAEQGTAYAWRTVATLSEPGVETDRWVGNACLTTSGRYAVVVYAPRAYTNQAGLFLRGGSTAVVDMSTGVVRKVPLNGSLAYYDPGCGEGERAVITQARSPEETREEKVSAASRMFVVDASSARVSAPVTQPGQVTSAVPVGAGIVAARGRELVSLSTAGAVRHLAWAATTPARVTAEGDGQVLYLSGSRELNGVTRVTTGPTPGTTEVARSEDGWLGLARGTGGRAFVVGEDVKVAELGGARVVRAPSNVEVSTEGDAVLTTTQTPAPRQDTAAWRQALTSPKGAAGDGPEPLHLVAQLTADDARLSFTVEPGVRAPAAYASGQAAGPGRSTAGRAKSQATGVEEPDASCAVPRNDPGSQTYQPTPRQVEWAADQAVVGNLLTARPSNWKQSGLTSWTPQTMFPAPALTGGGRVPVQVLLGILAQESNLWQASGHALSGVPGNPLIGNYYGRDIYDGTDANDWTINFSDADCGYGVGQVTDGMRKAGRTRTGETALPLKNQRAVALDYETNIAAALQILVSKWNQTKAAGIVHSNGDPASIENWFFAVWAYNSGFHVRGTTGQPWGVGWLNNPANPNYPPNRYLFGQFGTDPAHPQDWPYEEKVLGWAAYSIATLDGPGFRPAWWTTIGNRSAAEPPTYAFCDASIDCYPQARYTPNAPEVSGEPAGPCGHRNSAGQYDLQCWFNHAATYQDCTKGYCGHELLRFNTTYPEQPDGTNYPPVCSTAGLPSNALIVDDVPASSPSVRTCAHPWTEAGTFSLTAASESAKIDLHQIGAGMGGHFWFAHTRKSSDLGGSMKVTGTWRFSAATSKWARVLVHMPDHGAQTQQAAYTVNLGDGTSKTRYALQRTAANKWVSLGVMKFNGTPSISLSSQTYDGRGSDDVAWDAVALQPLAAKPANFVVAIGDSYSSGEGASDPAGGDDYYKETDVNGDLPDDMGRNACHRSPYAWSRKGVLKDSSSTIGARADSWDPTMDYQLQACSGAETENVLPYYSVPAGQAKPANLFGQTGRGQYGEVSHMDKGYLDANTTLVTVSMGGNDARFSDVVKECIYAAGLQECPNTELSGESDDMDVQVPRDINGRVRRSIEVTVVEVAKRAPNAKIVLMGYPKLLEDHGSCVFGIDANEGDWMNSMGTVMSDMFTNLVGTSTYGLQAAGYKVWYANPIGDFAGQAICGSPETIHGIDTNKTDGDPSGLNPVSNQSFHPTIAGTDHYRDALQRVLRLPAVGLGN